DVSKEVPTASLPVLCWGLARATRHKAVDINAAPKARRRSSGAVDGLAIGHQHNASARHPLSGVAQ
ncbi:MAG: hypothetical protein DRI90_14090, partial [Deltaproteobacteria bacterium]